MGSSTRVLALVIAAGSLLPLAGAYGQSTVRWAGPVSGGWSQPANWTPATVPNNSGAGTFDVVIDRAGSPYTVTLDIDATINSMTLTGPDASLARTGSRLTVTGDWNQTGVLVTGSAGGRITINGTTRLRNSRTLGLRSLVWNGPVLVDSDTSDDDLCDSDINHNGGTFTWQGSRNIQSGMGTRLTLSASTTFDIRNDRAFMWNNLGERPEIINNGAIVKTSGSGVTFFDNIRLNNKGTVSARSGTLRINNLLITGGTLTSGTYQAVNGGRLELPTGVITRNQARVIVDGAASSLAGLEALDTNLAGGRLEVLDGASLSTTAALANQGSIAVQGSGGLFTSAGLVNSGTLSVDQNAAALSNGTTTNTGTLSIGPGGAFRVGAGSALTNLASGVLSGGVFDITDGELRFDNADIRSVNTSLTLTAPNSRVVDQGGADGLRNLETIGASGRLAFEQDRDFDTAGDLTLAPTGLLRVGEASDVRIAPGSRLTNLASGTLSESILDLSGRLVADDASVQRLRGDTALRGSGGLFSPGGQDGFESLQVIETQGTLRVTSGRALTLRSLSGVRVEGRLEIGDDDDQSTVVTVEGDLDQTGSIAMAGGELRVLGSFAMRGELGGQGLVNANVASTGLISPGPDLGVLTIDGALTQSNAAGSGLRIEITGTDTAAFDQLLVTGQADFGGLNGRSGVLDVVFSPQAGYTPRYLDSFRVMSFQGRNGGEFAQYRGLELGGDRFLMPVWDETSLTLVYIPSPGGLAILGLAGLALGRRRSPQDPGNR